MHWAPHPWTHQVRLAARIVTLALPLNSREAIPLGNTLIVSQLQHATVELSN